MSPYVMNDLFWFGGAAPVGLRVSCDAGSFGANDGAESGRH